MKFTALKKTRVAIATVFFSIILFIFLDIKEWLPVSFVNSALYLQFLPSLLKFTKIVGIASAGFIFIILLTMLFGRVYCSAICPLGIMFDLIARLKSRKKRRREKFVYKQAQSISRYSILAITAISLLAGSVIILDLLDPFSNFGKISTVLIRPAVIFLNNAAAMGLEFFGNYAVEPFLFKNPDFLVLLFVMLFFVTVGYLAYKKGRLFCNTVCPVGTLLGLMAKYSLFKIQLVNEECVSCGLCVRSCKANCIDIENKKIDNSRCVGCFNCLTVCKKNGVSFHSVFKKSPTIHEPQPALASDSRRRFLATLGLLTTVAVKNAYPEQKKIKVATLNKIPVVRENPITPPGSHSIAHFTDVCVSCYMCVSACPSQVIQPSLLQYGFDGILMPHLKNTAGYCNYNCNKCSDVCPSGAILPIKLEEKKTVQIGVAKFVRENCVVILDGTECGACSEHCPTKAVTMEEENGLMVPVIKEELCVGCGACEYACPAKPYKSIYVEGNVTHQLAEKPKQEKLEEANPEEDFPF